MSAPSTSPPALATAVCGHGPGIVEEHDTETAAHDDERLVFARIEMAVRLNIGAGFDCVQQAVGQVGFRVKVVVFAAPRAAARLRRKRVERG